MHQRPKAIRRLWVGVKGGLAAQMLKHISCSLPVIGLDQVEELPHLSRDRVGRNSREFFGHRPLFSDNSRHVGIELSQAFFGPARPQSDAQRKAADYTKGTDTRVIEWRAFPIPGIHRRQSIPLPQTVKQLIGIRLLTTTSRLPPSV